MIKDKVSPQEFEQLALELGDVEEVELSDASISAEEREIRSATARRGLEARMKQDIELLKAPVDPEDLSAWKKRDEYKQETAWMEDYFALRDAGFPWRVAAYIAWAASPKIGRWPGTQEELATQVLGLTSDRQITTWRKKYPGIDDAIGLMQAKSLLDHRRDVFEALIKSASSSDHKSHQDRKLFLEMTGDYTPRIKVEDERQKVDPLDASDAELEEVIKRAGK